MEGKKKKKIYKQANYSHNEYMRAMILSTK